MGQHGGSVLAALAVLLLASSAAADNSLECQHLADAYLSQHHREAVPYTGTNMVYFLHVPRTAGRTFQSCFLKMATPPSKRCPKAYDHLRMNMSMPNCQLLSSHDDFSVVSMLQGDVAVLTHLRDPVDRVLSAYEFAIEVAVRYAQRPPSFKKKANKVATEDVWPWSYLVPFMAEDLRPKLAKARATPQPEHGQWIHVKHADGDQFYFNKVLNISRWNLTEEELATVLPPLNPYDNELVMPLRDFVRHPVAREVLHNGAAFQVLGITNYSHWGDAGSMRRCVWDSPSSMEHLLQVAKDRIARFFHVGVTDKLSESVMAAAVELGTTMEGKAYTTADPDDGPVRRKAAEEDDDSDVSAKDIPQLARGVREVRLELQASQKALFRLQQASATEAELSVLKKKVVDLRMQLRERQEKLMDARAKLPTDADKGLDEEAGKPLPKTDVDAKTLPGPIGAEYQRCAQRAQARNMQRRDNSLQQLAMSDGRYVMFTREARKAIPSDIIDYIRSVNTMDTALHELGSKMLGDRNEEYRQAGKLEELPKIPPVRALPKPRMGIPKPQRDEL